MKLAPSILAADFGNFERDARRLEAAGADYLHIDIMDGHFVPNITVGLPIVESLKKVTKLPLHLHTHYTSGMASMSCCRPKWS